MAEGRENRRGRPMGGPPGRGGPGGWGVMEKVRAKNIKGTLMRLLKYLGNSWGLIVLVMALVILAALFNLASPLLLGEAVDTMRFVDGRVQVDIDALLRILLQLGGIYALGSFAMLLQNYFIAGLAQNTVKVMRDDLFQKMQRLPLSFFHKAQSGDLMSRVTNDIETISMTLSQSLTHIIMSFINIGGALVLMLMLSPLMTLVVLVTVPLVLLTTSRIVKLSRKYFSAQQDTLGDLNGHIEEAISGQKTVKAFGREKQIIEEFLQKNDNLREVGIKAQVYSGLMGPVMNVINNISYALVAALGGYLAFNGAVGVTVGMITAFVQYARQFSRPISDIASQYNAIQSAIAGAERVFEVMDEPEELLVDPALAPIEGVRGRVEFEHVDFHYVAEKPVLQDFTLHVEPGQKIALVGPTGAGKTTVINLLTRFYDINGGCILLDGRDIQNISRNDLRQQMAVVLQDTHLFSGTVADNICYGRLDAAREEIIVAAQMANADGFITRLENGYDTELSEDGGNLSQGQRQLLSIARVVLSDPALLILDEATSSVDTRTEMNIQKAMIALMEGRTSFIIAHRLSTIRDADRIVYIHDGAIAESGSHQELLALKGHYYSLYQNQFARVEETIEQAMA